VIDGHRGDWWLDEQRAVVGRSARPVSEPEPGDRGDTDNKLPIASGQVGTVKEFFQSWAEEFDPTQ
jgi:hypothetical protein